MDYRRRAEEFRELARWAQDLSLQADYEALAQSYDELAKHLESRARSQPPRPASKIAEKRTGGAGVRRLH
jgi:hypothetical protein